MPLALEVADGVNAFIDAIDRLFGLRVHLGQTVEVLSKPLDLALEIDVVKVEDELDWHVVKHVHLIVLAKSDHVLKQVVLGGQLVMPFEVVHHVFEAVDTQVPKVTRSGHWTPFETEQSCRILFLQLDPMLPGLQHAPDQARVVAADH